MTSGSGRQSTVAVSAATSQASAAVAGKQQQDHDMSESEFGAYDEDAMDEEGEGEEEEEGGTLSVECVGFSSGDFKWIASGGLDKTMKVPALKHTYNNPHASTQTIPFSQTHTL